MHANIKISYYPNTFNIYDQTFCKLRLNCRLISSSLRDEKEWGLQGSPENVPVPVTIYLRQPYSLSFYL